MLGSTADQCAHHAGCPVVIVPAGSTWSDHPDVLVAVDGSDHAAHALAWALGSLGPAHVTAALAHDEAVLDELDIGSELRARLDAEAARQLEHCVDAAVELVGSTVEEPVGLILAGDPRTTVLDAAADEDLLVIGARGHSGLELLTLGSFADYALHHATVPLAIVHGPLAAGRGS